MKEVTASFARSYLKATYGELYFSHVFPSGAAYAFSTFCTTLSTLTSSSSSSSDREAAKSSLDTMLDRPLLHRLTSALSTLPSQNEHVFLSAHVHDARVSNVYVEYGPKVGTGLLPKLIRKRSDVTISEIGSEWYLFRWFSVGWIFGREDVNGREKTTMTMAMEAMEEGAVAKIDVVIDADITFRHTQRVESGSERDAASSGGTTEGEDAHGAQLAARVAAELSDGDGGGEKVIASESCRREITVQFTSPHVTYEVAQGGQALKEGPWRISDIDHLIESDLFRKYVERSERRRVEQEENEISR
ncbi:hypothetical protein HK104_004656 [Borealophlyctis nickersoniae]|nr:hypothetical protein HK104_004656 [Borealophlyctis nickersoniae]